MMTFNLHDQEYIELNKILKLVNVVESGGMANQVIVDGYVYVNNEQEFRKRKKLRAGDNVSFNGEKICIER